MDIPASKLSGSLPTVLPAVGDGSKGKGKFGCLRSVEPSKWISGAGAVVLCPKSVPPFLFIKLSLIRLQPGFPRNTPCLFLTQALKLFSLCMEGSLSPTAHARSTVDPLDTNPQQEETVGLNHMAIWHFTKMLESS